MGRNPGGPGPYVLFAPGGTTSSETMTETYGVLTVGSVTSGTVADGEQVAGAGAASPTAIDGNLSGSGAGSTWLVNNAQTVAGENMTMTAPPQRLPSASPTTLSLARQQIATISRFSQTETSASITILRR